jgi:hypothetical protein
MASTYFDTTDFGLPFQQQDTRRSNFTNNQATVRRAYYGCISYVDGLIGELLQALKDGGAEQETAVVFTGESESWCHLQLHFFCTKLPRFLLTPGDHGWHLGPCSARSDRSRLPYLYVLTLMFANFR